MTEEPKAYGAYTSSDSLYQTYSRYQKRYAATIRESDRVLIELVAQAIADLGGPKKLSLLDAGCSTGNLLRHIKERFPGLTLEGCDLMPGTIDQCRADAGLAGIALNVQDILEMEGPPRHDLVTSNAVLSLLSDVEFDRAIGSICRVLRPGGCLVAFEWFHPFQQHLQIIERSRSHPEGLTLYFRPFAPTREILEFHGLGRVAFSPFEIPIDLEAGALYGDNEDGFEDLNSYTIEKAGGGRLLFRGTLHQPWCHLVAWKTAADPA